MVTHFKDLTDAVRLSRKKLEAAVPLSFRALIGPDILAAAGARMTKTHVIAPLSSFRFLADDPDAAAFAKAHKVGLGMQATKNTTHLRTTTIPWPTGYGAYLIEMEAKGATLDTERMAVIAPKRVVKPKAKVVAKKTVAKKPAAKKPAAKKTVAAKK